MSRSDRIHSSAYQRELVQGSAGRAKETGAKPKEAAKAKPDSSVVDAIARQVTHRVNESRARESKHTPKKIDKIRKKIADNKFSKTEDAFFASSPDATPEPGSAKAVPGVIRPSTRLDRAGEASTFGVPEVKGVAGNLRETSNVEQMNTIQAEIDDLVARRNDTWNLIKKFQLNKEIAQRSTEYNALLATTEQVQLSDSDILKDVSADEASMALPGAPALRGSIGEKQQMGSEGLVSYSGETGVDTPSVPKGVSSPEGQRSLGTEEAFNLKQVEYNNLINSGTEFGKQSAKQVLEEVNALRTALFQEKAQQMANFEQQQAEAAADKVRMDAFRAQADIGMAVPTGPKSRTEAGNLRTTEHFGAVNNTESSGVDKPFVPKGVAGEMKLKSTEEVIDQKYDEYNKLMNEDTPFSRELAEGVLKEIELLGTQGFADAEEERADKVRMDAFRAQADIGMAVPKGPKSRLEAGNLRTTEHFGAVNTTETSGVNKPIVPEGVSSPEGQKSLTTRELYQEVSGKIEALTGLLDQLTEFKKAQLDELVGQKKEIIKYAEAQVNPDRAGKLFDLIAKLARSEKKGALNADLIKQLDAGESALFKEFVPGGFSADLSFVGAGGKGWNKDEKNPLYEAWREASGSAIKIE